MSSNANLYVYHQQEIIPIQDAFLHISDLAVQRGYGVFDYFKTQRSSALFLDDYLQRFYESARMMNLLVPLATTELKNVLNQLMAKNQLAESGIKIVLTGGYSADGYTIGEPNLIITQHALPLPTAAQVQQGIKIITHEYVRELPTAKTINYSTGIRLQQQLKTQGADDVLYHQNGVVSEFPRSNFFLVTADERVLTPAQDVLKGITRKNVLELAGKKYQAAETTITLTDIAQAREAFTTSTTKRVLPVVQIDGQPIGDGKPGPVTLALLQDLISLENQQV